MKKNGKIISAVLLVMILCCTGCTSNTKENTEAIHMGETEQVTPDNSEDGSTDIGVAEKVTVTIYHANALLTGFESEKAAIGSIDPTELLDVLCTYNIVSTDTRAVNFSQSEDGKTIYLDLNKAFQDYVKLMSEEGEYHILGSLTNTFLSAYGADQMYLTIGNESLVTKNKTYEECFTWYEIDDSQPAADEKEETIAPVTYVLDEQVIQDEYSDLCFIQLRNTFDNVKEAEVNTKLLQAAMNYEADGLMSYSMRYKVMTQTADLLSVVYYGSMYYDGAAYPTNFAVSFNINMSTLELIRLQDDTDVENISQRLQNGDFTLLTKSMTRETLDTYLETVDFTGFAENLKQYDLSAEEGVYPLGYSYRKDGVLCLILSVPHVLGEDYVELSFEEPGN